MISTFISIALVASIAQAKSHAVIQELKGSWIIVSGQFNGVKIPVVPEKKRTLKFSHDTFSTFENQNLGRTLSYKIRPGEKFMRIEILRPSDKAISHGLVSLKEDNLILCYAEPGAKRPEKLESPPEEKIFLLVLKRVKE